MKRWATVFLALLFLLSAMVMALAGEIRTKHTIIYLGQDCLIPTIIDVDDLFERVCDLMPEPPLKLPRLRIKILKDRQEVRIRYLEIEQCWKDIPAFYENILGIIYISQEDLEAGILSHEVAHFLMSRGYKNKPNHETQEAWAQYIETQIAVRRKN